MLKTVVFAKEKLGLENALRYLKLFTSDVTLFTGASGDRFPIEACDVEPDILISYLSPWVIPRKILEKVKLWPINFHPGPPSYPGIGCTNFAIYNEEKTYGVTAHVMKSKVDSGQIIDVRRFPLLQGDSVLSLSLRCYHYILIQFYEVIYFIMENGKLPKCDETWQRKPYTRRQLNELCRLEPTMSPEEVKRRIRATHYPGMPGAYIMFQGEKFNYEPREEE